MEPYLGQSISTERLNRLISAAASEGERWIHVASDDVVRRYNREPFLVQHRLTEHPLFTLPALFDLCRRLPRDRIGVRAGTIPVDADFDNSVSQFNGGLTLEDVLRDLEACRGYVVVNNPERDPSYRAAIEALLGELAMAIRPVDASMNWYSTYVFISAQDALTPYHMDREMNFLLQVRGTKTVKLWDPLDNEIMSPRERDLLLSYIGGRPAYRASFEGKARRFELMPGLGVHHPFIAPHLVHTGPETSVSLAITFRSKHSDRWTRAHRFNYRLRQLGLEPRPVRSSDTVDIAKSSTMELFQKAKAAGRALRQRPGTRTG